MKENVFTIIIERDPESGWFVGLVAELPGCYSQAKTREELSRNMKEAISVYLSVSPLEEQAHEYIGIERLPISV